MQFIIGFCVLLIFQLFGDFLAGLSLVESLIRIPGPVLGMLLLFIWLLLFRKRHLSLNKPVIDSANGLLKHLSLLFIPAGVGLIVYLDKIQGQWFALSISIVLGTMITMVSTAFCLFFLNRVLHFSSPSKSTVSQKK